jgi:fibro-slime domain-containing protein
VYAGPTPSTTGAASFDQWFRDVPGVNATTSSSIELVNAAPGAPVYTFDAPAFFPIDGQLLGNEGNSHNFHFTLELAVEFRYVGGEVFTFRGDDDLFAFVNRRLAIDLGGVHAAETRTIELDALAATHGLQPGTVYPLHLFFAERHTTGSSFHVSTTIAEFAICSE